MQFEFLSAFDHKKDMAEMYREYNALLLQTDPDFAPCLAMQNFDREIDELEIKFAPPHSALVIAFAPDGRAAGCVGIKKFSKDVCELKRLYVRPEYRKSGLGGTFTRMMIEKARELGYKKLYLDTMPGLEAALRLYMGLGFYEIEKYYNNPVENMIYLCYDL